MQSCHRYLLHRTLQVVITQESEDAAKMLKCQLVRLQKRLLRGSVIVHVKGPATRHRAHRKHINLLPLSCQVAMASYQSTCAKASPVFLLKEVMYNYRKPY